MMFSRIGLFGVDERRQLFSEISLRRSPCRGHQVPWRSWAPLKVKIFLWLAFKRCHWTRDRRRRHGLDAREECFLCNQTMETIDHILAECPVTREIWFLILSALHVTCPPAEITTINWWRRLRGLFVGERKKGLDFLFALVS